ncbi:hypothetical protein CAEBREN_18226 [Caenorhabditis brenneri]|uniref:Uncharacterized protein n=1 Tax=Caenorhabditis brenneri TaxID=135651 RepID=G0N410_CAEBE|nr:hypothetical protein CAEBREN_18226 [Caenorhabditis brenneri]
MSPTSKSPATDSVSQAPIEESGKTCGYSTKYLIIFSAATVIVITAVALTLFFVLQSAGTPEKLGGEGSEPGLLGATTQAPRKMSEEPTTLPDAPVNPTSPPSPPGTNEPPEEPTAGRPEVTETSATPQDSSGATEAPETSTTLSEPVDAPELSTVQPSTLDQPDELIYAQTLFRHGARAPDHKLSPELQKLFPNGKGKLTERGENTSILLGEFFRERYVESGFLDGNVDNKQMKWRSVDVSRCEKTAEYVARGMFQMENKIQIRVPDRDTDSLLNFPHGDCELTREYKKDICPLIFDRRRKHEHRNGFQNPKEIEENYETICQEFLKVRNLNNGIGNVTVIQAKFGRLMDKLLDDMRNAWNQYEDKKLLVKFRVYSTQDWVISGILEAFSLLSHIQSKEPREEPGYNTMILMELWKRNGRPFVKFYFKPEEFTQKNHKLQDLTDLVLRCQGSKDCPLENFTRCCDSTRIDEETLNEVCYPDPIEIEDDSDFVE